MEFKCIQCNKIYKSYQSLWNHNNKFHNTFNNIKSDKVQLESDQSQKISDLQKKYNCRKCNKLYFNKQSRWSHEKKCEGNKLKEQEIILKIKQEESKILKMKLQLQNSKSVSNNNVTIKKLNKMLDERNNLIKNSFNTTNIQNNNQQYIVNNFQLIGFGKEDVIDKLTNQEKKMIMNAKYSSFDKLIEIVHCGKYNQFKNIIITNLKDNYMYKYDDKEGRFVLSTKTDILNSLINYRLDDLEIIYNDLLQKNKLDNKTKDCIEKFINKINYDDDKYIDYDGKQHENYKQYKINEIKVLLFNNQDKITNDISLLLTTEETSDMD